MGKNSNIILRFMQHEHILKFQGKELKMPEWVDAGDAIIMLPEYLKAMQDIALFENDRRDRFFATKGDMNNMSNQLLLKHNNVNAAMDIMRLFTHDINPTHPLNTKFNGLFKNCVYGQDDDIAVKVRQFEFEGKVYKVGDVFEDECEDVNLAGNKVIRKDILVLYYGHHSVDLDISVTRYGFYLKGQSGLYSQEDFCNLSEYDKIGNLLDEYLQGGSELAKLCGFND